MIRKEYLIITILVVIILLLGMAIIYQTIPQDEGIEVKNETKNSTVQFETIANNSDEPGTVQVIRNVGNPNGKRIAYVVGIHPLENQTHKTLVKLLTNMTGLNCCYDIYMVNVTRDIGYYGDGSSDDSPGRQNGQVLAYEYVYPEILNGSYEMAIDIHSNVGAYPYKTFVFSPVKESPSVKYANDVARNSSNISYYAPDTTTSGPYLTVPLNENGVPAFYFEEYSFAPQDDMEAHVMELIRAVDNLKV